MTGSISDETQSQDSYTPISDTTFSGGKSVDENWDGDLPKIFIGTPHNYPSISANFCHSLRNMWIPFPMTWEVASSRFIPDGRNSLIYTALENGFDYIMQLDADQKFNSEFFLNLWRGIKEYGDDAIITGWSKCKSGKFAKQPSVFRQKGHDIVSVSYSELEHTKGYIEVDSFGTCGFLASAKLFRKIRPPWFADINIIREGKRINELYVASEFAVGQDIAFAARVREAGGTIHCSTEAYMPHEIVSFL